MIFNVNLVFVHFAELMTSQKRITALMHFTLNFANFLNTRHRNNKPTGS